MDNDMGQKNQATNRMVNPLSWILLVLIRGYQLLLSPLLGQRCRYYPSCSHYAVGSIKQHGFVKGLLLSGWRILRCNPWSPGGVDEVPSKGSWTSSKVIEVSTKPIGMV